MIDEHTENCKSLGDSKDSIAPRRIREEKKGFIAKWKTNKLKSVNMKQPLPYIMLGSGLVLGLVISAFLPLGEHGKNIDDGFEQAIESSGIGIEFANIDYPEGWESTQSDSDVSKSSKQNPLPGLSASCSFTPSTIYLPKENLGLGSEYLSKELLLTVTKENSKVGLPLKSKISLNGKSAATWERQGEKTLTVARVFDGQVVDAPKGFKDSPPRGLETMTDSGVPAVVMTYSCQNAKDVNFDVAHSLIDATSIVLSSADN